MQYKFPWFKPFLSKNPGGLKVNQIKVAYSKMAAAKNAMQERTQTSMAVMVSASGAPDLSELPMFTSMRKMVTRSDILPGNFMVEFQDYICSGNL